jgi:heat shock protein HslJ
MFTIQTKKECNMKTHLRLLILVIISITITCCTNINNKPNKVLINESIVITTDSANNINTTSCINNDSCCIVWSFLTINNEDVNDYVYETPPFLTFSLDSAFIIINTGCNYYIGECTLNNNNIKFERIKIKDELICPIDALEREIVYMLESSNHYLLNDNNFVLFTNEHPIGLLTKDTINCNYIYP